MSQDEGAAGVVPIDGDAQARKVVADQEGLWGVVEQAVEYVGTRLSG